MKHHTDKNTPPRRAVQKLRRQNLWRQRLALPAYTVREAARLVQVHRTTLTRWYFPPRGASGAKAKPVIERREPGRPLSYLDLIEAAMVSELRDIGVSLKNVRGAHEWLRRELGVDHPFARIELLTEGKRVLYRLRKEQGAEWVDKLLVEASGKGQVTWADPFRHRLRRFEFDRTLGFAMRWFPRGQECPVVVDPRRQFGKPILLKSGIPTWVIRSRVQAGEPLRSVQEDFEIDEGEIRSALEFEGMCESAEAA